ncbi:hypothetical protein E2C01_060293 [Portunus trituberculatus]|uniref:Uncharacterized protein n=1 Tax=Portunus trituberculatus TaxID=210409 RepID=A0A5B7HA23_PORTR|nr:hypothetical protein [Portunus trituberculatus]
MERVMVLKGLTSVNVARERDSPDERGGGRGLWREVETVSVGGWRGGEVVGVVGQRGGHSAAPCKRSHWQAHHHFDRFSDLWVGLVRHLDLLCHVTLWREEGESRCESIRDTSDR